ncbi:hypothetical protein LPB72_16595 [Hydrogenophaga crassostreae]|uniref:NodB homology domain-containing protein n=1 Tax=Hydrogenophaga crassostreae TaxID=1763535 RepID=A0A162VV00_9BURK|nr:hypothetical protein [Hydrogenophaga crassostreae]AOW12647.1 hypothetical protein LPB072_07110 [Hydrogenophaga crassostreae]OAD40519.1 hypothetical protein LPB72_16595 [Hydrogenophaga crassostreae]
MNPFENLFRNDPFRSFYNLNGTDVVALTMDIDWAPDYAVEAVLELVSNAGMKITAFATHQSPLLIQSQKFVEIGLHPDNTRPHPVHGFSQKITKLREMYPDSIGLRCHRNFFGQNISDFAVQSGIEYDVSSFLWQTPLAQGHIDYNGLVKLSYIWEDGIHVDVGNPLDVNSLPLDGPGLKIFNVHPMLIYLNAPTDDLRKTLTRGISDLVSVPESHFSGSQFGGYGLKNLYRDFLGELTRRNIRTVFVREIAAAVSKTGT